MQTNYKKAVCQNCGFDWDVQESNPVNTAPISSSVGSETVKSKKSKKWIIVLIIIGSLATIGWIIDEFDSQNTISNNIINEFSNTGKI